MSRPQAGWRACFACMVLMLAGCTCSKRPGAEQEGTGGSGAPAPLGQDSTRREGEELVLEVLDVAVEGEGAEASGTSFVTGERITARGRVRNAEELDQHLVDLGVPDARPYYGLSVLTRDPDTRIGLLRRTLALAPKHPEVHKKSPWTSTPMCALAPGS